MQQPCTSTYLLAVFLFTLDSKLAGEAFQPEFAEPLINLTVPIGRDATFKCLVQNLGGYRIAWVKTDTKEIQAIHLHVITDNERVSVSHNDQTIWNLHIRNVQEEDRGRYMCQINTDPMKSQMGYLEVFIPPDIIDEETSGDIVVQEGEIASLSCRATGTPEPQISWRREDGAYIVLREANGTETRVTVHNAPVLTLSKITNTDMGAYLCIASNGVRPSVSKRININVLFPPVIHVPNQLFGAPLGIDITLECYVKSSPRSIIYWLRNSNTNNSLDEMVIHSSKYELKNTALSPVENGMTLTVRQLTATDFGSYRCIAKNSLGEAESVIRLCEISETPSIVNSSPPTEKENYYFTTTEAPDYEYGSFNNSDDEYDTDFMTNITDIFDTNKTQTNTITNKIIHSSTNPVDEPKLSNKFSKIINNENDNKDLDASASCKLHSCLLNILSVLVCMLCFM